MNANGATSHLHKHRIKNYHAEREREREREREMGGRETDLNLSPKGIVLKEANTISLSLSHSL